MSKSRALEKPVIQINGPRQIRYLCFDVDRQFAGIAWDDANLPQPTFVVINPKNLHAHLIYEIADPVWLRAKDDARPGEAKPVRYLKAVTKAIRRSLNADGGYTGLLVKNPFHTSWRVICGPARPYTLAGLAMHLDFNDSDAEIQDNPEGRNCTLFDSIRFWAYRHRNDYTDLSRFRSDLDDELDRLNQQLPVPLPFREVCGISKSVASWVWDKYTGNGCIKHRGIMGLDPTESLRIRQQKGQAYTSSRRTDSTIDKITRAIDSLTRDSKPVTKVAVASLAGIHRNTVARYWTVVQETVSLRDKSSSSLRSEAATPGQGDTLIHTHVSTQKAPTYHDLLAEYEGDMLRAIWQAGRYANQGILIDEIPKSFKTTLENVVDKVNQRDLN